MDKHINRHEAKTSDMKKTICWMVVFVVIAAVTVYAVVAQNSDFSISEFIDYIKSTDPIYLILALVSMLGYVIFEGIAVLIICKAVGYKRKLRNGFIYSASDIYFSAITPSATGGQPASAWFMMKDGIPGATSAVVLVTNLVFYTISILFIGIFTFICSPSMFFDFSITSKILILIGYVLLAGLAIFFILLLFKEKIIYSIGSGIIKLLAKIRIIKNPEKFDNKLKNYMQQYKHCAALIMQHKKMMLIAFLFNFLQRAIQITVTALAALSGGGDIGQATKAWLVQSYTIVGSNCVPIPGAMGVSDYILLDGLGNMMSGEDAVHLELLSRSISFYSMIVICGITVLISYILSWNKQKQNKESI